MLSYVSAAVRSERNKDTDRYGTHTVKQVLNKMELNIGTHDCICPHKVCKEYLNILWLLVKRQEWK